MYCDGCASGNTSLALLSPAGAAAGPDAVSAPPLLNLSLERELLFRFFSDFFLKMGMIASLCWDFDFVGAPEPMTSLLIVFLAGST